MHARIKRIYEPASHDDGMRILVDRLWPRGISRGEAQLDEWVKELAPSDELRNWFNHEENRWRKFRERYLDELKEHREQARKIAEAARESTVTLLFAAKDEEHNNAVVLRQYLEMLEPRNEA